MEEISQKIVCPCCSRGTVQKRRLLSKILSLPVQGKTAGWLTESIEDFLLSESIPLDKLMEIRKELTASIAKQRNLHGTVKILDRYFTNANRCFYCCHSF
ncbi:hypothetical protein LCM00_02370 [Bacillus infantis]|uniref:hypothetical protein n=1 Tax=Bacillus infantis TaxID=324767 RepID=UPI001CD2DE4D|nr:hypothetical protein [Bacillus infantis]MCA1038343.1 hypothetical protein [Bacillus infantis]